MTEQQGQQDWAGGLRKLSDPEFFARWAAVRSRLSYTAAGQPEHSDFKMQYRALTAEYRRRMAGGLAETNPDNPDN